MEGLGVGAWNPDTDPHTVRGDGYEIVYWNGPSASGKKHATRGVIQTLWASGWLPFAEFELPAKSWELESMSRSIARVYSKGKEARSAEILKLLGGK